METNIKPTLLWCPQCKTDTISSEADAKCKVCNGTLIKVMYSIMDGSRITGVEPFQMPPIFLPGVKS